MLTKDDQKNVGWSLFVCPPHLKSEKSNPHEECVLVGEKERKSGWVAEIGIN